MKEITYFRRCHRCGEVNQASSKDLDRCSHCKKSFAPFYYFDEAKVTVLTDKGGSRESQQSEQSYYHPLRGLSAYW